NDGVVILSGAVLKDELDELLRTVGSIPGVERVENTLILRDEPAEISELQGRARRRRAGRWSVGFIQEDWDPRTRAVATLTGAAMVATGVTRRGVPSIPLSLLGGAPLVRAI